MQRARDGLKKQAGWIGHVAVSLCVLAGAGCDGSDSGPGDEQHGHVDLNPSSVESFAEQLARAMCDNLFSCRLGYTDASQMRALLEDEATCRTAVLPTLMDSKREFLLNIELKTHTYRAEHASACLERFAHQCFVFEAEEPEDAFETICAGVFEGSVADGGACTDDADCSGDAYCDQSGFNTCDQGVCRARLSQGAACNENTQCSTPDESLAVYCSGTDSTPGVCVHATQVTHVGEGAECGELTTGDQATLALCDDGLVCGYDSLGPDAPETKHCRTPPSTGDCSTLRECAKGNICLNTGEDDADGNTVRRCVGFDLHGLNEACTPETADYSTLTHLALCADPTGKQALYCDDGGHCVVVPQAGPGESCVEFDCVEGLVCTYDADQGDDVCAAMVGLGEECLGDDQCPRGSVCNGTCSADSCQ
ncbi:MAG: hypothetical protein QM778_27550 [Myxococcales bacterium]